MTSTAFVTGSTGFLGRHLCQQLQQDHWQVVAMCRSIPENPVNGVNYVTADLLDAQALQQAIPKQVPVIFHTAADTNTWFKNNPRQTDKQVLMMFSYSNHDQFVYTVRVCIFAIIIT